MSLLITVITVFAPVSYCDPISVYVKSKIVVFRKPVLECDALKWKDNFSRALVCTKIHLTLRPITCNYKGILNLYINDLQLKRFLSSGYSPMRPD